MLKGAPRSGITRSSTGSRRRRAEAEGEADEIEGSGEGTEKLIALVGSKAAAAELGEVETDTWAEVWQENDIPTGQLPRPPEKPPVVAVACTQENGTDNGCQAMDIAPDTLPRPPEPDREEDMATLKAEALESIVLMFGDRAPEDFPPNVKAAYEHLSASWEPRT